MHRIGLMSFVNIYICTATYVLTRVLTLIKRKKNVSAIKRRLMKTVQVAVEF